MIVVAAAVIREAPGAPVLLTRRMEGAHLAGMWEFPGGKVEEGELPLGPYSTRVMSKKRRN